MSSDLYDSSIDDDVYGTLSLEMNVNCWLKIIAYDPSNRDFVGCCQFPPTQDGLNEAQSLIDALQVWMRRVKDLKPYRVVLDSDALSNNARVGLTGHHNTCIDCKEKFWTSIPGRDIRAACFAYREVDCNE